ncbi:beta-galactosidase-1-like protein 3 [Moschus berezovskii]|uniref:beta-galactosidase-1-like protein 3 n=1 Tax=Moschus berezovskii TaxID=68408 RepID=UPI002444CA80|nr:beta-galactosidase-1-like protein 3 [Moschus berezovskii]
MGPPGAGSPSAPPSLRGLPPSIRGQPGALARGGRPRGSPGLPGAAGPQRASAPAQHPGGRAAPSPPARPRDPPRCPSCPRGRRPPGGRVHRQPSAQREAGGGTAPAAPVQLGDPLPGPPGASPPAGVPGGPLVLSAPVSPGEEACLPEPGARPLLPSGLKPQQPGFLQEAAGAFSPGGLATASPSGPSRFDWSHLTPRQLKNRSRGLQTEEPAGRNPCFTLEGHEFLILGGSVHYFRVPRASWRDRLLKLQACGLNTVSTYVPWNLHEPERGTFDFSGNLDLEAFILLAAEVGLWVILRPGPYICSEMDLGGLPSWLLQDPASQLRTTNRSFVNAVNKYFDHLIPRVAPLQYHRGGPIIAVQVENEYGSFYRDKAYMPYLLQALLQRGVGGLLLTADNTEDVTRGHVKGVLASINMKGFKVDSFKHLYKLQSHKPVLIMEFWVGWFDTWGNDHKVMGVNEVEKSVSEFIRFGISFNVYMFHGGTNFGFMNGATSFEKHRGVTTSYDYDAVLTEAGDYTTKYFMLRNLFESILVRPLPPLPSPTPKAVYPPLKLSHYLPLWEALPYLQRPVTSDVPLNMENLPINNGSGQSFGLVLYEVTVCSGGRLHASAQDEAQVFLNETSLGILTNVYQDIDIPPITECQLLRILVENQGRVNFSWKIQNQRKGLIGPVTLDKIPLNWFTIYPLELKMRFFKKLRSAPWRPLGDPSSSPAFHLGTLTAGSSPQDTFLQLPGWNHGCVFINGRNLGRYWNIGPQEALYLPGSWLQPGANEIVVFEKEKSGSVIYSTDVRRWGGLGPDSLLHCPSPSPVRVQAKQYIQDVTQHRPQ